MTREEQFDWLYRLRSRVPLYMPNNWVIPMNNALDMAIKALEQEPKTDILDKIRAEIKDNRDEWIKGQDPEWHTYDRCLQIIDKYKAESEE